MKTKVAIAALAVSLFAAQAHAFDIQLNGKAGLGGELGGSFDFSGAAGLSGTRTLGNAAAWAENQSYGMSESTFSGKFDTGGNGSFRLQGATLAGSGSLSQASVTSSGNGFGAAAAGGIGAGLGLSGGIAGFGKATGSN